MSWKCPVCGGDPLGDDSAARAAIAPFVTSSHCNPGGRTLTIDDGATLSLSECCNLCDAKVVLDYLANRRNAAGARCDAVHHIDGQGYQCEMRRGHHCEHMGKGKAGTPLVWPQ